MSGWTYRETPSDQDVAYTIEGPDPVADVYGPDIANVSCREVEARARVLCAAPAMLAALKAFVAGCDHLHTPELQQARAAIAKATGEAAQ